MITPIEIILIIIASLYIIDILLDSRPSHWFVDNIEIIMKVISHFFVGYAGITIFSVGVAAVMSQLGNKYYNLTVKITIATLLYFGLIMIIVPSFRRWLRKKGITIAEIVIGILLVCLIVIALGYYF